MVFMAILFPCLDLKIICTVLVYRVIHHYRTLIQEIIKDAKIKTKKAVKVS